MFLSSLDLVSADDKSVVEFQTSRDLPGTPAGSTWFAVVADGETLEVFPSRQEAEDSIRGIYQAAEPLAL
jgi:hypothetical protein